MDSQSCKPIDSSTPALLTILSDQQLMDEDAYTELPCYLDYRAVGVGTYKRRCAYRRVAASLATLRSCCRPVSGLRREQSKGTPFSRTERSRSMSKSATVSTTGVFPEGFSIIGFCAVSTLPGVRRRWKRGAEAPQSP